jgi:hypothetical protein
MDWEQFDKELEEVREHNRLWQQEFDKVCEITFEARKLEKTDPLKAIQLYESIKNTNYGNFDTLGRLIILYRKTKQKEKEAECIEYKIEDLQNREYNSKEFLKTKYPEDADEIQNCYDNQTIYTTPELVKIDFHKNIIKLQERLKIVKK